LGVHAFTLGDLRGSALIGRALDVTVEVRAGDAEDVSASCLAADVYYSEARQIAPNVTVSLPSAAATGWLVRVQLAEVVSEPIVTVLLRSTCGASNMRRYVLFADLPQAANVNLPNVDVAGPGSLQSATGASVGAIAAPVVVLLPQSENTTNKPGKPKLAKTSATHKPNVKTGKPKKAAAGPAGSPDLSLKKETARPVGKSLLKLDPMERLSDRIDSLDSVMFFASTEDALKQTKQISNLETDMKALRALAAKNDAKLLELRTQLEQAQQIPSLLIYGLGALVVLSLAGFAWLWQRQRRGKSDGDAWWHDPDKVESKVVAGSPDSKFPTVPKPPAVVEPVVPVPAKPRASLEKPHAKPLQEVDLNIDLDNFMLSDSAVPQTSEDDGSGKRAKAVHHLNAESILDIRQQAEFFVSLGQTERALQLLNNQIAESDEPNPFVYLDLISLYHSLGLKTDFQEQSEAFERHFNCQLPDFSEFTREGSDLESYPEVLSALVQQWPTNAAQAFLDASIYLDPRAQPKLGFDLAAFRDLLMLHALADVVSEEQSESVSAKLPVLTAKKAVLPEPIVELDQPSVSMSFPEPDRESVPESVSLTIEPPVTVNMKTAAPELDISLLDEKSLPDIPVPESPSRMLDLDFSTLTAPAKLEEDAEPLKSAPLRYATRSRWPVTKKPTPK
jgi:hypothetical protein